MNKRITVNDKFQKNYSYQLTAPTGRSFSPDFKPHLTPRQMLELGVFGGKYMTDCKKEFPASWFKNAKLRPEKSNPKINYFKVSASQSLNYWKEKNWINPIDPRGWFQWYSRYYLGRRTDDDTRQIKRWRAMSRHVTQIKKNCKEGDINCRRKQKQALLHWAYDSRNM
ncbi:MAG: hypothetical protein COU06_02720 [Candidatus Harrisonbacteria bacterium CG10_big_fil_rev_8_21_14_0_10_38_8]|uniref:Uncharacterized protein n=1 Tax=Candidatus Harrisonbacteria bacterium CG10_big_fil_rev_8_21_14_0_10_38_8 TaxID=1974582 RepID=A0A2M6WJG1_9BACT|nr:MAG: hypothetical protein COU06_02720 [Candidatus Harrisonbacteria bacterium CG10_big_fil_rev_8_21_14_0_10_38_8]